MVLRVCLLFILLSLPGLAQSGPRDPLYIMRFYQHFISQGVPVQPLKNSLLYMMENWGNKLPTEVKSGKEILVKINNPRYIGIVDFNKSSLQKRFWILDLKTGKLKTHWVSHGTKTGGVYAYQFSNILNTQQTSLGFYLTGPYYTGKFGRSMRLYGLDSTNNQAFDRDIVLHPASYVSYKYAYKNLRIGRSHGCLAVSYESIQDILKTLPPGSLIYAYHDQLQDENLETMIPSNDNPEMTEEERTQRP